MPTLAIASTGIALRLGDGIQAVLTVTGATNAAPIVVTTSTPHGVVDVSHATITGVVGNTAANGDWIVQALSPTTLRLRGSVGNGVYASGGVFTLDSTYATIAEVTNIEDAGIECTVIDVSAHDSLDGWSSKIPTMLGTTAMRLSLNHVPDHPTHDGTTGLWFLMVNRIRRPYLLVLPDAAKTTWWYSGWVTMDQDNAAMAAALTSQVTFTFADMPLLAAA